MIVFLLAGTTAAGYSRVAGYPFVDLDDPINFFGNTVVAGGLTLDGIRWAFTTFHHANWYPMTWLSHMVDVTLFGIAPGKHHLVNLLFHLVDTLLLFHVLRRMTGRLWPCAMAAALFAIHPLHVESVAWVSARKDVLSAFFFLVSLWSYLHYCERRGTARYFAVLLPFALGLMAKPMLVTLPFVLLLLDYWPLRRLAGWAPVFSEGPDGGCPPVSPAKAVLEKVPLLILSALSCLITIIAQGTESTTASLELLPLWTRAENAVASYAGYLWKAVWPAGLAVFYPMLRSADLHGRALIAALFLLVVTAAAIWQARKRPYLVVGWCWYLGMLVPVIGIVQVGTQAMADRYTYLPLIGPFLAVAWGSGEAAARLRVPKGAVVAAAGAWLVLLWTCTWVQVGTWRDSISLYRHAAQVTEDNWFAHRYLGLDALRAGRREEALAHFREVIRVGPGYSDALYAEMLSFRRQEDIDAETNLYLEKQWEAIAATASFANENGLTFARTGRIAEASHFFREAVRVRPDYAEAHYNLGVALGRLGTKDEALIHFREALKIPPVDAEAQNRIGVSLYRLGRFEEAAARFRDALHERPDYGEAEYNLAAALERTGRTDEAIARLREILRRRPEDADATNSLARLLGNKAGAPGGADQGGRDPAGGRRPPLR